MSPDYYIRDARCPFGLREDLGTAIEVEHGKEGTARDIVHLAKMLIDVCPGLVIGCELHSGRSHVTERLDHGIFKPRRFEKYHESAIWLLPFVSRFCIGRVLFLMTPFVCFR